MPYVRKFKTDAELSAFRSEIAKNRKNRKGGRPKGSPNKNPSLGGASKTMTVREPDYRVFVKCAFADNVPLVQFMHKNAEGLKARNPHLFSDSAPTVEA